MTRGSGTEQTTDIYEYNAMGQILNVTQNGSVTSALYDAAGRMVKLTDPQGLENTFTYDGLGRMTSRTDIQGTVQWQYDDANGIVTRSESGATQTYTYDILGQLVKVQTGDGNTFTYAYDAQGRMTAENWSGTGGTGSRTYAYDTYGDVTAITGPFGKTITYNRGDLGRIDSKVFAGNTIGYTYDGLYQLKQMSSPAGTFKFFYDNFTGALVNTVYPNTGNTHYGRNMLGELTAMEYQQPGGGDPMISYNITLDTLGRRTSVAADQPVAPTFIPEELQFAYSDNPIGQLLTLNGQNVNHDARGNLTALPEPVSGAFTYDALNRLTGAGSTQHSYDTSRNRIETTRDSVKTRYLLDVNSPLPDVLATMDESNNVQELFIHGPGGLLASVKDGVTSFVHQDFNHNVVALTDSTTGDVKAAFAYTPQGKWAGSSGDDSFPFRFAGGVGAMTDPEGLIYMRARYYHPGIRQFTSPDLIAGSMGKPQSLGRYAYVEGMALGGVDPSGLKIQPFTMSNLRYKQKAYIAFANEVEKLINHWTISNPYSKEMTDTSYGDTMPAYEIMRIAREKGDIETAREISFKIYDTAINYLSEDAAKKKLDYKDPRTWNIALWGGRGMEMREQIFLEWWLSGSFFEAVPVSELRKYQSNLPKKLQVQYSKVVPAKKYKVEGFEIIQGMHDAYPDSPSEVIDTGTYGAKTFYNSLTGNYTNSMNN